MSVLVIDRSAAGANESTSVAELLPVFGSVVDGGAEIVAVLVNEPVVDASTSAVTVKVAVPEAERVMSSLMSPEPAAVQF